MRSLSERERFSLSFRIGLKFDRGALRRSYEIKPYDLNSNLRLNFRGIFYRFRIPFISNLTKVFAASFALFRVKPKL